MVNVSIFKQVFENSPVGMTICDATGQCIVANDAICEIIGAEKEQVLAQNYFTIESWRQSGLLTKATEAVRSRQKTSQKFTLISSFGKQLTANVIFMPFSSDGEEYLLCTFDDLSDLQKMEDEREKLIVELQETVNEVQTLRSILPLCCYCKKVRDDEGYWERVDIYIHKHNLADISHSICPECMLKHYPDTDLDNSPAEGNK